ncbi:hypothetical protein ABT282_07970 [Streptomyces sp. NPDC000927]|uniref:hypothetical protein n=1 Tax=Streptomyces sp. NPDC000927 TaxID=3154371 RepID=UPI00333429DB
MTTSFGVSMDADLKFPIERHRVMTGMEWADWLDRLTKAYQGDFLKKMNLLRMAENLADGREGEYSVQFKDEAIRQSALLAISDYAVYLLWRRYKIAYDVDPTVQESLADMETTDVLPGDILRQLPHPNPLYVWPAGHEVTSQTGEQAIVRAMYVTGRTSNRKPCDTHDERASDYQLTFVSDLLNEEGEVYTTDSIRMSFELSPKATSIKKIVEEVMKDFSWEPLLPDQASRESKRNYMRSLMQFGVAHLLYACSDKADVDRPVASRTIAKGKNKGEPTKGAILSHPFGWRVGPAIQEAKNSVERAERSISGSGGTVRPHIRKAHLHSFRHGAGRTR